MFSNNIKLDTSFIKGEIKLFIQKCEFVIKKAFPILYCFAIIF